MASSSPNSVPWHAGRPAHREPRRNRSSFRRHLSLHFSLAGVSLGLAASSPRAIRPRRPDSSHLGDPPRSHAARPSIVRHWALPANAAGPDRTASAADNSAARTLAARPLTQQRVPVVGSAAVRRHRRLTSQSSAPLEHVSGRCGAVWWDVGVCGTDPELGLGCATSASRRSAQSAAAKSSTVARIRFEPH